MNRAEMKLQFLRLLPIFTTGSHDYFVEYSKAISYHSTLSLHQFTWRGAGAVELATLERWYTGNGIVGSNPTLSAIPHKAGSNYP